MRCLPLETTDTMASEKTSIQTLDGVAAGRYVVTTHSGTRHYVDLDAKMATRKEGDE